ncbi:cysteine synthase [Maridesulfovibrio hydrothermalis]|uniref:cysteine synthase n=1 Tax=Maridesulfovibrio hydrothermalis AM13 = DSM 14728 TaxID=1121451 RepID=L0R620_9BACT|nr:cysteine synthase [Maridesulfovibrio hydrothermalis]CCO22138.1 Cysteine synthase [Maridesulfovibrio hydrothermalis AM13 = DSM 14728]
MFANDILELVGGTPLVEMRLLNPNKKVKILAKLEAMNPGGSIKDRAAGAMIRKAEAAGELTSGKIIIEATSGNTGIGLAMACAVKGYKLMLIMPETASEERKMIMKAYGADIMLTPGHLATDGAIEQAYRFYREEPEKYLLMDQYNNEASVEAHYTGTGQEIWDQTEGKVTHVVACLGTTGTVMGITRRLKELNKDIQVIAVEPEPGHKIQGLKNMQESYPPGIYDKQKLDRVIRVKDNDAFDACRRLAREEGIFVGMSSGAAMVGAADIAAELDEGLLVTIFPDGGERYLSTPLFRPQVLKGPKVFDHCTGEDKILSLSEAETGLFTLGPSFDNPYDPEPFRRIVMLDVLGRHLEREGCKVSTLVGLADLEDQTLAVSRERGVERNVFARETTSAIRKAASLLGVRKTMRFSRASESIDRTVELCRTLLAHGLAYEKLRSVYFDISRDKGYGQMCNMDIDKVSLGKTVDMDEYVKENPRDFTLLKRATLQDLKLGDIIETEWGNVRPSWFMQQAVTALEGLPGVSLLLAGEIHRFPHLENLRAIWAGAGVSPQAWMVAQPVLPGGAVLPCVDELIEKAGQPMAVRMWMLSSSYKKPLVCSDQAIAMWVKNQQRLQDLAAGLSVLAGSSGQISEDIDQEVFTLKSGLSQALNDNLKLHRFWPILFSFSKAINSLLGSGKISGKEAEFCLAQLLEVDDILGILDHDAMPLPFASLPEEAKVLLEQRELARAKKDFSTADAMRDHLLELGFNVEDSCEGARVFKAK